MGELGQFVDLRAAWQERGGGGGDTPMPPMVAKFASVHEHVLVLKEALASSRFNILLSKVT